MRLTVVLQQQRAETRHQGASKLLQLQPTMTQQLNGVASSLEVPAAEDRAWMPARCGSASRRWTRSAALRKQQQISQQAHAQLLELSTRGAARPRAAAGGGGAQPAPCRAGDRTPRRRGGPMSCRCCRAPTHARHPHGTRTDCTLTAHALRTLHRSKC